MSDVKPAVIAQPLRGVRVLMVDDYPEGLEPACILLQALGADVKCLTSARAALDEMPSFRPSILVLDVMLPEIDGIDLLHEIRALSPEVGGAPAIAFTADVRPAVKARALAAGFVTVIEKPAEPFLLVEAVETVARALA